MEKNPSFEIDLFCPADAEGVALLFSAVYGDGYPVKLVYNPEALTAAFEARENIPVVARTSEGEIVGYCALFRSAPHPGLYEAGQGLTLKAWRSRGIMDRLNYHLCEIVAPRFQVDTVFGEAVCNHILMQKSWSGLGAIETAFEVDLMSAEAYSTEESASGRVATVDGFRTYRSKPQTLNVPEVYRDMLCYIYDGFDDERTCAVSGGFPPRGMTTNLNTQYFAFAQVARMTVHEAGTDFERVLEIEEEEILRRGMMVIQVWLKLSWPWVGAVTGILRKRGYFTGGALPRWFDEDGLLMQKIMGKPNWEGIQVCSQRAERILRLVRRDWEAVSGVS